jgi:hypothetical protein
VPNSSVSLFECPNCRAKYKLVRAQGDPKLLKPPNHLSKVWRAIPRPRWWNGTQVFPRRSPAKTSDNAALWLNPDAIIRAIRRWLSLREQTLYQRQRPARLKRGVL